MLGILFSCGGKGDEIQCYPTRVKRTISTGTGANSITADYKYTGDLVDRIIWSNSQTHYYYYDDQRRLTEIERVNVARLQKTELFFTYEENLLTRIDNYLVNLDYVTQEDVDTVFTGYREMTYDAGRVIEENIYDVLTEQDDEIQHTYREKFEYDASGNLTSFEVIDMVRNTPVESYTMTYDLANNPYSAIDIYFDEASHVNNIVEKQDHIANETYSYTISYNANSYPQQIIIKLEGYLSEAISFDYECR
jgi:hypothetical protein